MRIEELAGPAPNGWKYKTLGTACKDGGGEIQTGPFGSQLHASDYVSVGIPSIMPQNIGDNRLIEDGIARITKEDSQRLSRYLVRSGDIIYSRRGDVERRALIRDTEEGWLCGTGCLRVRLGETGADPRYTSYYLGHPEVRKWIVRHALGATMPNLNTSILSACPFLEPPKDVQRAIAQTLGTLDDKIELNRRLSETLEAIAKALFKAWFLTNEVDRSIKQPRTLRNVLTLHYGKGLRKADRRAGSVPVFGSGGVFDYHDKALIQGPSIIVGRKGTVGSLYWVDGPLHPGDTVFYVESDYPLTYCYYLLQTLGLDKLNTDAAVPGLNRDNACRLEVPLAPRSLIDEFDEVVLPMRERIRTGVAESKTLATLRDTLLPKLISWELRTKDAERLVSEVV